MTSTRFLPQTPIRARGLRFFGVALAFALAACAPERADPPPALPGEPPAPLTVDDLHTAARDVLAFLRGEVPFDSMHLADTVVLYVSPIGGGTRTPLPREELRERSNWVAPGFGRARYGFVPPPAATRLTTRVGQHLNCFEFDLESRFPELANLPHVGTKHELPDADSCIQTWNLTLVFDEHERPPMLVAALYDQWEW